MLFYYLPGFLWVNNPKRAQLGWVALLFWLGVSLGCSQMMDVAGTLGWGLAVRGGHLSHSFHVVVGSSHAAPLCALIWASLKVVSEWKVSKSKILREQSESCVAFYDLTLEVTSTTFYWLQASPCSTYIQGDGTKSLYLNERSTEVTLKTMRNERYCDHL